MTENVIEAAFAATKDFDPDAEARPPEFADDALALRFTEKHKNELRYVQGWGKWLLWDGQRWAFEPTLKAFDFARAVCRGVAAGCDKDRTATAIASAKTIAAVEKLAKADRRHAATVEQWDADPWLLNTPDGVVDLRSDEMRQHEREDYMTKIAAVSPGGKCPLWHDFLHRVTDDDLGLESFLQRVVGYALTGSTQEHSMFFLYGPGANGKSVFLNTISGILQDYAITAPMEAFLVASTERHPTDIAGLRGARLVTATEPEEGRRWAEAKIKALTGGDTVSARFMRQDFFEFSPQFKLVVAGNHKPGLSNIDEAIRRRLHLIPFTVTIPPEDRDLDLEEKLEGEWPGILRWAIGGCLQWQRGGLAPPEAVRAATDEYLESEDALAQWIGECCVTAPDEYATIAVLFASWKAWAEKAGEFVGSQKRFGQSLRDRGYVPQRQGGTGRAGFMGIGLYQEDMSDAYWNR